jgi:hypothetical protein
VRREHQQQQSGEQRSHGLSMHPAG